MTEKWLKVDGWEMYEVSNLGRVRRIKGDGFRLLKLYVNGKGYLQAHLRDCGREKNAPVHRLVALAFIGGPPSFRHEVAHEDGDGRNARVDNLSWKLPADNNADKKRHGTYSYGERHWTARLSADAVRLIRELGTHGLTHGQVAICVGCSRRHVGKVLGGEQRRLG